jgi:hypothetical protein
MSGSWRGRDFAGADYADAIRENLDKRLSKLGLA